ncbi:valine--tRNA ligase [Virgisporangium aliadipatigenens]|uniref:Valine--tRNA ligase n=1 Tax=Virgisporangium aliadipatigenens TaxID=741659 RepID=A0A8J3YR24_9ACTN|nr:valine--tRNA ligase [Virgisporangium aliadipatigenens]GIJ50084.1 valine--tRNA ligase [Virgisporangium aliadipatigenens]
MTDTVQRAVPARPELAGLEEKWARRWQEEGTYAFDRSADRADVYAIDTPPPSVSGVLHVGHVFSFTHTDLVARYQRMRGKAVFYPMGWDDNGLPTERRVENFFKVRCDPTLPYVPGLENPSGPVSRRNFIEICEQMTALDEKAFEELWRTLGLSVDWSLTYTTIGDVARAASQRAFLRNLARGEAYLAEAPTLWDVTFGTAVAQAELEDRESSGAMHRLRFGAASGFLEIDTTRPELLPACVAVVCHPSDERYASLVGSFVRTPIFGVSVPVFAHPAADPAKGTGLVMVCTFGDLTDVTWWRDLDLDTRVVIGRDGRFLATAPSDVDGRAYAPLAGLTPQQARRAIVERLRDRGDLVGEPYPVRHQVKYYEKGAAPLEIVTSRQWYIRNGGRDNALRAALLERGGDLEWIPAHMRHRYDHWVGGLTGDWLISRQRFFGVPFPVWYPISADGTVEHGRPLTPDESRLPVDPTTDVPDGYTEAQRGKPGGFAAERDVMDTWATSSLTPQIAGGWERDPALFAKVFPYDLRPQAHEIIRTWLFGTVVRAHLEHGVLPWRRAVISGWILDPDRKKIGKSLGNAVTPTGHLERYGSDAVRYWAAQGRPGADLAFDEGQMRIGRRLATKVLNASRFVLGFGHSDAPVTAPLDRSMLAELSTVVDAATAAFDAYDHTSALAGTERFFWTFCDDYIELVKERAYSGDESARSALHSALSVMLRLFAPFLPYATEEVWSWWREGSIHRAPWPTEHFPGEPAVFAAVAGALSQVRRAKSERKVSMRTPVLAARIIGPATDLGHIQDALPDLRAAGHLNAVSFAPSEDGALRVSCTI